MQNFRSAKLLCRATQAPLGRREVCPRFYADRMFSPDNRSKCLRLLVSRVTPWRSAVEPIRRSRSPIGVPASFNLPLSQANILADVVVKLDELIPLDELLQNLLATGRVGRVENSLVKSCYSYDAYAYTFRRQRAEYPLALVYLIFQGYHVGRSLFPAVSVRSRYCRQAPSRVRQQLQVDESVVWMLPCPSQRREWLIGTPFSR